MKQTTEEILRARDIDVANVEKRLSYERLLRTDAEHRLANYLQIVSTNLMRLGRDAGTEQARQVIGVAADQIVALGKLQQALAQPTLMSTEDGSVRLHMLCTTLKGLVAEPQGHGLTFGTEAGPFDGFLIPSDIAHSLVLIVSEFVINAVKHAFSAGTKGSIKVTLERSADRVSCNVSDDGTGTLSNRDCFTSRGMLLARNIAESAGGICSWVFSESGTEARVSFRLHGDEGSCLTYQTGVGAGVDSISGLMIDELGGQVSTTRVRSYLSDKGRPERVSDNETAGLQD